MKSNLAGVIVAVALSVIILGSILVPEINEYRVTAGDEVTYSNPTGDSNLYMRELQNGDVLELVADGTNAIAVSLNGDSVLNIAGSSSFPYHSILFSDVYTLWVGASVIQSGKLGNTSATYGGTGTTTYTYNDGEFATEYVSTSGTTTTGTISGITWGYVCCNEDEAEYYESVRTGSTPFYVSDANDVVCSGIYTTGDLDTYYWYYNGESGGNDGFTVTTECELTLVDGTTDIYTTTPLVTVTDGTDTETFTPYRIMIPLEVEGHATSGALYDIYGVIPAIVILGVLMSVAYLIIRRD